MGKPLPSPLIKKGGGRNFCTKMNKCQKRVECDVINAYLDPNCYKHRIDFEVLQRLGLLFYKLAEGFGVARDNVFYKN